MATFTLTLVEKGILRCKHAGVFSPDEIQALAHFFDDYRGKLLIDLTDTTSAECARHIHQFRPMMPTTAIFGAGLDPKILDIAASYYTHDVKYFQTETEALTWLRNQ